MPRLCTFCDKLSHPSFEFCGYCGHEIFDLKCPKCGVLPEGWLYRFCPQCGSKMVSREQSDEMPDGV